CSGFSRARTSLHFSQRCQNCLFLLALKGHPTHDGISRREWAPSRIWFLCVYVYAAALRGNRLTSAHRRLRLVLLLVDLKVLLERSKCLLRPSQIAALQR